MRVYEQAHGGIFARTPHTNYVKAKGVHNQIAAGKHTKRSTERKRGRVRRIHAVVFFFPNKRRATKRIAIALHAQLIAVINAGNTRQAHLQQRRKPQALFGKRTGSVAQTIAIFVFFTQILFCGSIAEQRKYTFAVVTTQQIKLSIKNIARIVYLQRFDCLCQIIGRTSARHIRNYCLTQGIVHSCIKLFTLKISAQTAV